MSNFSISISITLLAMCTPMALIMIFMLWWDHRSHKKQRSIKITARKWDASEYLDSSEMIREYLKAALEKGDMEFFMTAIGNVAKAKK